MTVSGFRGSGFKVLKVQRFWILRLKILFYALWASEVLMSLLAPILEFGFWIADLRYRFALSF